MINVFLPPISANFKVDDQALHAQIQENRKKPVTKSKFQIKLEEMAKKRGFDTDKLGGK